MRHLRSPSPGTHDAMRRLPTPSRPPQVPLTQETLVLDPPPLPSPVGLLLSALPGKTSTNPTCFRRVSRVPHFSRLVLFLDLSFQPVTSPPIFAPFYSMISSLRSMVLFRVFAPLSLETLPSFLGFFGFLLIAIPLPVFSGVFPFANHQ